MKLRDLPPGDSFVLLGATCVPQPEFTVSEQVAGYASTADLTICKDVRGGEHTMSSDTEVQVINRPNQQEKS